MPCICLLQVSSQHPYAEQYIGKPHVMTVDYNNSLEFDSAIREIMRTKVLCAHSLCTVVSNENETCELNLFLSIEKQELLDVFSH